MLYIRNLASPRPVAVVAAVAVASRKVYLTTLLSKVLRISAFFGGRGRDGQTDKWTDKLFSENIILDVKHKS